MAKLLTGTRIYGTGTVDTQLFVNGTEQAVSTTTGALEVIGGAGIGGNLYVGGLSVLAGVQSTNIVASGTLGVTATSTLGVLNATSATFSGTLGVTGTSVLTGVQASNIVVSGTLGVTGTSTLAGLTLVTNTTSATSTTTGALVVSGGVGIGQDLRVGGVIYGTFNGAVTGIVTTATNIAGGTAGQVPFQTAAGVTSFYGPGTAGNVLVSNGAAAPSYNNTLTLAGTTAATSTNTGVLQVFGGVGVGGNLYVGGSTSSFIGNVGVGTVAPTWKVDTNLGVIAGSSISTGGYNVTGDATTQVGYTTYNMQLNNSTANASGYMRLARTASTAYLGMQIGSQSRDGIAFLVGSVTPTEQVRISAAGIVTISTTTNATSTSTGALQVVGGVGIGRSLFVQEDIVQVGATHSTLAATYNLINTTATTVNFAGAATTLNVGATSGSTNVRNNLVISGNLTVQGTTTIVDSTVTNIADPIITLGGGSGNNNPTADDNKDRGIAFKWVNNGGTTSTGFFGYDDSTGFLTYIQTATITNEVVSGTKGAVDANLAGGTAMSLVYQSAANTTEFLAAGSSGFILQTNGTGSAPTWVSSAGIGAGSATNSDAIRTIERTTAAAHFLTFVDSNNATNAYESLYTTSTVSINPSTGRLDAPVLSAANTVRNSADYFEKVFPSVVSFTNGVANLAVDVRIGNISVWGYIEIEVNSSWSNQNSTGKLTKLFAIGTNPSNLIYTNESRIVDMMGAISANITIGEFQWDAANTTYKIPVSHIVSTGNAYTIKVRCFGFNTGADTVLANTTISAPYTLTALAAHSGVYYNSNLIVGDSSTIYRLDVNGETGIRGANYLYMGHSAIGTNWGGRLRTSGGQFQVDAGSFRIADGGYTNAITWISGSTTGNVGVGTASPSARLTVTTSTNSATTTASSIALHLFNLGSDGITTTRPNQTGIGFGQSSTRAAIVAGTFGNDYIDFFNNGDIVTPKVRMRASGAIAFGGIGNIGSSGQILQSNGDASPTWINASSITSGATSLTSTHVGFGSGSNLLTGSSNLTWNGTTLYVNGRLLNAGGLRTYSVQTTGQGNVNAVYEIMKISRDNVNWSTNTSYEITVRSTYYTPGGYAKYLLSYGYFDAGTLVCTYAGGGTGMLRVYLGTEVTVNANCQYKPVFVDLPPYMMCTVEVRYNTNEVASVGAINSSGQVFFSNIMTASGGTGAFYNGDTHLVPSGGSVGVGTTSPTARLHVTEANKVFDATGNLNVYTSDAPTNDFGGAIALGGRNGQGTDPYVFGKIKGAKEAGGTWNGYLSLGTTRTNSAITEAMRINSAGSLLIGTTSSPSSGARLLISTESFPSTTEVNTEFRSGTTSPTSERYVLLSQTYTGAEFDSPMLAFRANANVSNQSAFGTIRTTAAGDIVFSNISATNSAISAASEKVRITATGGVAFGGAANYGSSGQVLQSNGDTAPTWVNASTLASGSATNANAIRTIRRTTDASHFLTFVDSNNASNAYESVYTTSTIVVNPGTRFVGIGTSTAAVFSSLFPATLAIQSIGNQDSIIARTDPAATNAGAAVFHQASATPGFDAFRITTVSASTTQPALQIISGVTDATGAGGTSIFYVRQDGNVGIGTATPSGKLHLYQTSGGSNILTLDTNFASGNAYAINPFITGVSNGGFSIRDVTNAVERIVISATVGNIGMGTTTPQYELDVNNGATSSNSFQASFGTTMSAGFWSGIHFGYSESSNQLYRKSAIIFERQDSSARGKVHILNNSVNGSASATLADARLTITFDGNVGIGTTNPINKFEVAGTAGQLFSVSDSFTGTIFSVNDVSGIPSIEVLDTGLVKIAQYNGTVAIGTGTGVSSSTVSIFGMLHTMGTLGEIRASSEITAYFSSDARLKENIKLIENPITIIDQIRGVTFDWTDEHMSRRGGEDGYFVRKHDIGVIAQEVQAVLPELVGTREDGYLAVKYEKLTPLLIEAIKSQQKTIDMLVKDLANIKEFINQIKNKDGM
jgi:hypothetical protein